jgi:hypothetical protein
MKTLHNIVINNSKIPSFELRGDDGYCAIRTLTVLNMINSL